MSQPPSPGSSPYATGGGGVQLEHEYAASALASLLLAQPVEGLGDELQRRMSPCSKARGHLSTT